MGKKLLLFLVEGRTDRDTFERPIQSLMDSLDAYVDAEFVEAKGDITTTRLSDSQKLEDSIYSNYLKEFFAIYPYYEAKDILQIVQICDLDAAFIPNQYCKQYDLVHNVLKGFVYDPPYIYGETANAVIERNNTKATNLRHLIRLTEITVKRAKVPYSICFLSTNLEHCLYGKLNATPREKIEYADRFADRCEDLEEFKKELKNPEHKTPCNTIEESWKFIQKEMHSFERYTNLDLLMDTIIEKVARRD
ncbi:MAG: hypothetical protein J5850_01745 [Clostridia bacterium]|nr:hypothetical protein [Clostridia bacterium]